MRGIGQNLATFAGAVAATGLPGSSLAASVGQGANTLGGLQAQLSAGGPLAKRATSGASGLVSLAPDANSVYKFTPIQFAVNPASVKLSRASSAYASRTLVETSFQDRVTNTNLVTITMDDIHILGDPYTGTTVSELLNLTKPYAKAATAGGGAIGAGLSTASGLISSSVSPTQTPGSGGGAATEADFRLPIVDLTWGNGLKCTALVTNVVANITRFATSGAPISAKVSLTFLQYELTATSLFTNPTSGGLPGRARHTVVAGDSLLRIAVDNYGDARAWRAIAMANELDDPLRVGAGHQLYLPGPAELDEFESGGQPYQVSAA